MKKSLEQFIRDHRDEFDTDPASPAIWEGVEKNLRSTSRARMVKMNLVRWSAVAATLIIGLMITYYLFTKPENSKSDAVASVDIMSIDPGYAKQVYHFTQLIELKQHELKQIEHDEPELYRSFMGDINTLDSSYNALKQQLPQNPNREQLLEAMIQNLQLQTELLNRQLMIIKKIKQKSDESPSV